MTLKIKILLTVGGVIFLMTFIFIWGYFNSTYRCKPLSSPNDRPLIVCDDGKVYTYTQGGKP